MTSLHIFFFLSSFNRFAFTDVLSVAHITKGHISRASLDIVTTLSAEDDVNGVVKGWVDRCRWSMIEANRSGA
eukprot:scaffold13611_cov78-Skeletonema_marinoi.AAC.4